MTHPSAHELNRRVFADPRVVEFYATSDGLTPCELQVFDAYVPAGSDILDLGVGAGRTIPFLRSRAGRYVGVDYVPAMVEACEERFPDLSFREADASDLGDFEDESFDVVVFSFNGIDYLSPDERRERCLAECRRVLRPGGTFILSRHNPRAIVRLPASPASVRAFAMVPLWTQRRALRLGVGSARVFWTGEGTVPEPAEGFNAPILPWRRRRASSAGDWPAGAMLTHMATPRRAQAELDRFGFDVMTTAGSSLPRTEHILVAPWYYYAAIKRR